jgi:hypothetical protein
LPQQSSLNYSDFEKVNPFQTEQAWFPLACFIV